MPNHSLTTFTINYCIVQLKEMTTGTNAQTLTSQAATTVELQKTTYTYLKNVQEYQNYGRLVKPYLQNW